MPNSTRPSCCRLAPFLVAFAACTAFAAAQVRVDVLPTRQLSYAMSSSLGQPIQINGMAAGDIDGDGDLDLAVARNDAGSGFYRNDGDGVFAPFTAVAGMHTLVALADFDGDGHLDLFFAGGTTAYQVSLPCELLRNDGTGHFTPFGSLPSLALDVTSLQVADRDNDGDLDILIDSSYGLRYLRNDGGGTFTNQTATTSPLGAMCDLDGDHVIDVIGTGPSGYGFYHGNGGGTFTFMPGVPPGVPVGDLDGDGDVDMISATHQVLRNDGGLSFTAIGGVPLVAIGPGINFVDLDGDGYREIVGTPGGFVLGQSRPFVLRHGGNFVFQDVSAAWFGPLAENAIDYVWNACLAFDADGDGDPDVVTGGAEGRGTSSTTVGIPPRLFLNAQTHFVEATAPVFPRLQQAAAPACAGDVDGDGDVDLVFGGLWKQDENGRFVPGSPLPPPNGFQPYGNCGPGLFADLDGDGDLDLFLTDGPGNDIYGFPVVPRLLRNNGQGIFTALVLPASSATVGTACAAGDVDGDGDIDIVLGGRSSGWQGPGDRLRLLRNDGNGTFTDAAAQMPSVLYECGFLALRDVDGDGDLDIVAATEYMFSSPQGALLFLNDGAGHFTDVTATHLPALPDSWGLAVLDLDGDGDLDFVQQHRNTQLAGFNLINDGTGTFTAVSGTHGQYVVDWAGDGARVDIRVGQMITVGSTMVGLTQWLQSTPLSAVLPVDLDQDGDIDLVVGNLPGLQPDLAYGQGIMLNLQRDLRIAGLPRLGQPYRVRLRAVNGAAATVAAVGTSAALLPQRVPLPGIAGGLLAIDLAQLLVLDVAIVPDSDTAAEVVHVLPNQPALLGLRLASQALFIPVGHEADAHLSNAVTDIIVR